MKQLIIILIIAILYAINRAFHDNYLNDGKWKIFAFIEGVIFDASITYLIVIGFNMEWWFSIFISLIFAFVFWTVFDITCGILWGGSPLYIGTTGFDAWVRKVTAYKKGYGFLIFKLTWLVILIGSYFDLLKWY